MSTKSPNISNEKKVSGEQFSITESIDALSVCSTERCIWMERKL